MVNVNKLKAKVVEAGLNIDAFADATGINRATIYRRFKNPEEITIEEADKMVNTLKMSATDAMAIFFTQCVA